MDGAPCKFFAQGRCAFGNVCRFAHVAPRGPGPRLPEARFPDALSPPAAVEERGNAPRGAPQNSAGRELCRFFANGGCTYGDRCRNLHELPAEADFRIPAGAFDDYNGDVFGGGDAFGWDRAGEDTQEEWPARLGGAGPAGAAGPQGPAQFAAEQAPPVGVDDAECGICFESIRRKNERFGMLENCDHAFCLTCIRSWRKQREQQDRQNLRLCPVCRNESFFVVPADKLILDPKVKHGMIETYKAEMMRIPCKLFDYGRGSCPFGNSCFYVHLNPDGTRHTPAPLRRMVGAEGTQVYGDVKLSQFFA